MANMQHFSENVVFFIALIANHAIADVDVECRLFFPLPYVFFLYIFFYTVE